MTGIIDYGCGNLHSVAKALLRLGHPARVVATGADMTRCDRLILPGVGAFPDAMRALEPYAGDIRRAVSDGVPLLGICLGMQLLFEHSDECGGADGLGLLPGCVRRFPEGLIVPNMGWAPLQDAHGELFDGVGPMDAYFVHSYFCPLGDFTAARATHATDDGSIKAEFSAAVQRGHLFGTQFHPEKSGRHGLMLIDNFARIG